MPRHLLISCLLPIGFLSAGCRPGSYGQDISLDRIVLIEVENPTEAPRPAANVALTVAELVRVARDFNPNCLALDDGKLDLPVQADDLDLDGVPDEVVFQVDLPPKGRKTLRLFYNPSRAAVTQYPKRARAAVFPELEGPAWESDVIAYRLCLDGRNAIDVFGKSEPSQPGGDLVRYALGKDGYRDVHTWGVNVLRAGDTLGCGSFGFWLDNAVVKPVEAQRTKDLYALRRYAQVIADGPVRAILRVTYDNWVVDEVPRTVRWTHTIWAGRRWATCDLDLGPRGWRPTVAVGVAAAQDAPMVRKKEYFYTFGNQTVPMSDTKKPESLGLGVLFKQEHFAAFVDEAPTAGAIDEADRSRVVLLTPDAAGRLKWWYFAAWGRGKLGVRDAASFESLCEATLYELRTPRKLSLQAR